MGANLSERCCLESKESREISGNIVDMSRLLSLGRCRRFNLPVIPGRRKAANPE
jgi:hypothetical protein